MDFVYEVKTEEGKKETGIITAANKEQAVEALNDRNLFIISLKEEGKQSVWKKKISLEHIGAKDVAIFSRQFAVMIEANVPVVGSLRALSRQMTNKKFKGIIVEVADKVEEGSSLSAALANFPQVFDSFFVNVIRSGEASGRLGDALSYLADHLEREHRLVSQVRGAMTYPAFILVVFVLAFILIMTFVVPNLLEALSEFDQELPAITKMIISISDFFTGIGGILLGIFLVLTLVGLYFWIRKTESGRKFFDQFQLGVPLGVGDLLKKFYLTRFSENFSVLVKSGLPISEALKITGNIVGSYPYEQALQRTQKKVVRGEKISNSLDNFPKLFPAFVTQMIRVGEVTGHLDETLENIIAFYQTEVDAAVKSLTSIIEPVLIIVMGILVGFLVIGVFLPIFTVQMSALNM